MITRKYLYNDRCKTEPFHEFYQPIRIQKKISRLVVLSFFLFLISNKTTAVSDIDSLFNISQYGTSEQKISAYYHLASKSKNLENAVEMYDSALYYYYLNPNDSDLVIIYEARARTYGKFKSFELAKKNIFYAIDNAKITNNQKAVARMCVYISKIYFKQHQYDSTIVYQQQALPIYQELYDNGSISKEELNKSKAIAELYIGKSNYKKHKYDKATQYLYSSLKLYEQLKDSIGIINCHLNIGNIFNAKGDKAKAGEEYQYGLFYAKGIRKDRIVNVFYTNLGALFLSEGKYDSANYYFDKSLEYLEKRNNTKYSIAGIYNNKGLIYKHLNQFDSALFFYNKALELYKEIGYKNGEIKTNTNIAVTLIRMGNYRKAEKLLLEIKDYSVEHNMIVSAKEIFLALSYVYTEQKKYKKALEAYQTHIIYYDSLNSVVVSNKINEYKEQYDTEKKDQEIKLLEQQAEVSRLKQEKIVSDAQKQKIIGILLSIISVFLIIAIFFMQRYFKLKQKSAQELIKKNAEASQQKMLDMLKEQELKSINSFMSGQEKERNRIASELHDRLGSLLSAVKLHFSSIEADIDEDKVEERENFSFALNLLDNSVDEVRSISHNLSKGVLMQFGLSEAIKNLRDTINAAGQLKINFIEAGPEFNLLPEVEIEIFRVIQELITNAIKHSQAEEIFVQLISDGEELTIVVEDQGVGFNIKKINKQGIGLLNLKSRIEKIGGVYNIESAVGKGTSIIIEIKYKSK